MANEKRKKVEEHILKYIKAIATGNENYLRYKALFESMDDTQFHDFMIKLKENKITLSIIVPTGSNIKVDVENNFKLARQLGYEFIQQLNFTANGSIPEFISPEKYLVFKLPVKRAAQLLSKGISIPEDNNSIDMYSGQVTNKSKSSKLTMPELYILLGLGLKDSIVELMKTRGGDLGEANALTNLLYKQGRVSQRELAQYSTGVVSTKVLNSYFNGMHIKTTLN